MDILLSLVGAGVVALVTVGSGFLVARRFQKLGGGEAQDRLNAIRKELDDAMEDKTKLLSDQFDGCKTRLLAVEGGMRKQQERHTEATRRWGVERREFRREIFDLHTELRRLRPDRTGAKDRADD